MVSAGEVVPADGAVVDGRASIDQHRLTGESQPSEKTSGDPVFAATIVIAGKIYVKAEKTGKETAAAKIGAILENATSLPPGWRRKGRGWRTRR